MMAHPSTPQPQPPFSTLFPPSAAAAFAGISSNRSAVSGTSTPTGSTYLMPTSPAKSSLGRKDGLTPKISKTTGQKPACLGNASVTDCGNDQIYAVGALVYTLSEVDALPL